MTRLKKLGVLFALLAGFLVGMPARAQVVGACVDQSRGLTVQFRADGFMFVPGTTMNGFTRRDPSGVMFLQLPAAVPWQQAFFISWNREFVEVNQTGVRLIGACQFNPAYIPPNPNVHVWSPPAPSVNQGVYNGTQFVPLPQALVTQQVVNAPFAPPLLVAEARAQQCWAQSGGQRAAFGDCMVRSMVGDRERAAYDCVRRGGNNRAVAATCMVGALGGQRERAIASAVAQCQQRFGSNYNQYPLCMASQNLNVGGEAGKLIACLQQQGSTGNVNMLGTAVCYGSGALNLNAEAQIAVQCAATTGGEPYSFAACAGGQLTARELDKCFTGGIGGQNGCFGPNNTIVQALNQTGQILGQQFGPNNDLVRAWNTAARDITSGPGPNNEFVKVFRNVGNQVGRTFGPNNDIRKAVERVVPRIRIRF